MYIVKVLRRRDAASIIVAIILALCVGQYITMLAFTLTNKLTGVDGPQGLQGTSTKEAYINPLIAVLIQLLLLEIIVRLYVAIHGLVVNKK